MNVRPAQIIIVNGIQEALNIVARLFVDKGTPVAIENPCYQGALSTFESYGAKMLPVPVDQNGIRTDELPDRPVSLIYVTPSHQFPTGGSCDRGQGVAECGPELARAGRASGIYQFWRLRRPPQSDTQDISRTAGLPTEFPARAFW